MKAQNFVYENAKPDGLTLSFNPFQAMAQTISAPTLRFKYENFTLIGGLDAPSYMLMARTDIVPGGLKISADIAKTGKLKYTHRNAAHNIDLVITSPSI